uniref:Uncharacterized protein n=1 Tax=Opuntia streptacantha TaxID=393608 RepID=A0A7C9F468_OPUST
MMTSFIPFSGSSRSFQCMPLLLTALPSTAYCSSSYNPRNNENPGNSSRTITHFLGKEGSWSNLLKRKFPRRPVTNTSRYPTTAAVLTLENSVEVRNAMETCKLTYTK